eukprot:3178340-Pyramimonas_sp.AAC.1
MHGFRKRNGTMSASWGLFGGHLGAPLGRCGGLVRGPSGMDLAWSGSLWGLLGSVLGTAAGLLQAS